jgi:hypothetical protein
MLSWTRKYMRARKQVQKVYSLSPLFFSEWLLRERHAEREGKRERERMKKFCVVDSFTNGFRLLAPRISQCSMSEKLTFLNHLLWVSGSQMRLCGRLVHSALS